MQWCFIKKQIGGNRDGRKESAKIHFSFDSPVKKLYKRKRKLLRFRDLQLISSVSLLIKIKSFYEVYTWNSPYLWATSGSHIGLSDTWKTIIFTGRAPCWDRMQQCNATQLVLACCAKCNLTVSTWVFFGWVCAARDWVQIGTPF